MCEIEKDVVIRAAEAERKNSYEGKDRFGNGDGGDDVELDKVSGEL